ncbi:MAG TPA: HAMP domain-containing sensor histidine kinase [Candidatus Dormibacteraeota bacterium]|nr:HAMP domain-containing sensor histidine kinase [Candidatus Dormibacteraeota bacterium]
MFARTRVHLTILYVVLFVLVLGVFSVAFYVGIRTALAPTFDLGPELTNDQAAAAAYRLTIDRIGYALVAADVFVIALVAAAAWLLASRTLRPIGEAQARQRRFVADASHEMRTPIAAIRASAEGALAAPASEADLRAALQTVVESAGRLSQLTNDLLLLARADELPPALHRAPVDMSVVVAEALSAFATAHPTLPRPRTVLGADLPVAVDPDEVGRIVANLVANAYRHAGATSPPRVRTRMVERDVIVEVVDSGPGIAAQNLERVFEPFWRLRADAGMQDGNGLGLTIARSLARRNGGRLSVTSRPGEGATFRLAVPRFR